VRSGSGPMGIPEFYPFFSFPHPLPLFLLPSCFSPLFFSSSFLKVVEISPLNMADVGLFPKSRLPTNTPPLLHFHSSSPPPLFPFPFFLLPFLPPFFVKKRQARCAQMKPAQTWGYDAREDSFPLFPSPPPFHFFPFFSSPPLSLRRNTNSNLIFQNGVPRSYRRPRPRLFSSFMLFLPPPLLFLLFLQKI